MDTLVGRAGELEVLLSEAHIASLRVPRVVVLEGPSGIGKSVLVRAFLDRVSAPCVLRAAGDEMESGLACALIDQLLASATPWPDQLPPREPTVPNQCLDPFAVGADLLQVVGVLQQRGLVVIALDDAQWADTQSLQAMSFAMRRLHADAVFLLIATRDASGLPQALRRLSDERGRVLRLEGLDVDELAQLADRVGVGQLPRETLVRLREHTAGSPLHASALLQELPADVLRHGGLLPAPRSFSLLMVSRLAACDEETRRLVSAAAVLGIQADLRQVSAVADVNDLPQALQQAVDAGFLTVRQDPAAHTAAFSHPMIRAAVYDNLGPARRCELHARAAGLLDGGAALEHECAANLGLDGALARRLVEHSAEEARRGELSSAARHLLQASRLTPSACERERYLLESVELWLAAGEVTKASTLIADVGSLPESARRRFVLGHLALIRGHPREAEEQLTAAWEAADPEADHDLRVLSCELLAELCARQVRPEEAISWARRALELCPSGDLGSSAFTTLVVLLALVGRPGEALPLVEALPKDAVHPTARDLAGMLARGIVRTWIAELPSAISDLSKVLELTRPVLGSRLGLTTLAYLAHAEYLGGQWVESAAHADLAVAAAIAGGQQWLLPLVHGAAAWVPAARGEWDLAEAHVRAAHEAARLLGDPASAAHACDAEVRLAFCRHDYKRVTATADRVLVLGGREVVDEPGVFAWQELLADALVSLGSLDEARSVLARLEGRLSSRPRRRLAWLNRARVRGNLEAALGHHDNARAAFEEGLAYPEADLAPFERALLEEAYGRFLRRAGKRREAMERLASAHAGFAGLGARPFQKRTEDEMDACGLRPRGRSVFPQGELTAQELAVARLVAEGLTNREVSEALVVSPKTVEYHLGNIFPKLGITSRRRLRERLAQGPPGKTRLLGTND